MLSRKWNIYLLVYLRLWNYDPYNEYSSIFFFVDDAFASQMLNFNEVQHNLQNRPNCFYKILQ